MKKSKILNIALTTVMLLSTVLTPQMSHALADMQAEDAERTSEVEETDVDVINEEPADDTTDNSDDGNSAEVVDVDGENEPIEPKDEKPVESDDAVENGEPMDVDNNSPPVEDNEEKGKSDTDVDNESGKVASFHFELQAALGNIFTNPRLTLNDEEIQNDDIIDINENTTVQLAYEWHTEDLDVYAGDTASILLPDIFKQVNVQNQKVITGGLNVGTYDIVDGQLTITFNENIESGAVSNGVVGLNLNFDMEKFVENIEQRIAFNDRDETTLDVIARPTGDISGIIKEGQPNRNPNATEITWTVDMMNDNDEPITKATLRDILPGGLGEPRDFLIHELSVGLNGNKRVGNAVNLEPQVDGNEFMFEFDEIAPFNGYQIQYTTTIEDLKATEFTNDATFSYDDTKLPAKATVDKLERSNPVQKTGEVKYWPNEHIEWTITVNENGLEIEDAIVHDDLPEHLTLDSDSIQILKNGEPTDLTATGFPITLGKVGSDEVYTITFKTDIDWSLINGGNYQEENDFTNETQLIDGEDPLGEDDATVKLWRRSLLEKLGDADGFNHEDKVLSWKITVNETGHPIKNAVLTDTLPAGLGIISPEDITIEGADIDTDAIIVTQNDDGTQIVIINLGDIDSEVTVSYQTEVEDFDQDSFMNKVELGGEGVGEDTPEDEVTVRPPANSFAKDYDAIDYNEKTIDWSLTVNPIREAITELTIVDTFPNKGMILLPDTLVVKVGGVEVEEGFTLRPNEEDGVRGYHKGFTIVFDNELLPLNAQMEITYQTSYDPQREVEGNTLDLHANVEEENPVRVYKNHAQFTGETENGNEFDTGREDEETVREDSWNSGKKEGQLVREDADGNLISGWQSGNERKIAWQLYTNYQQQNLGTDVVIEDTLGYEGTIDEGSVVVSVYTVDANGNTTITDEILSDEYYTVDYDGDSFTLAFNGDFIVEERYVVEFTTTVPDISQSNYTNNATVRVGENKSDYSGTVSYEKHNSFLNKGAIGIDGNQVFTGDEIEWEVTVNESLSIIENATITDTISSGLVYIEDSLVITTTSGRELTLEDYTLDVSFTDDETVLFIELTEELSEMLVLNYTTVVTETEGQVNNAVELNGENFEKKTISSQQLNAREFSWVDGDFSPNRGAIRLEKFDAEEEVIIENNEATFELWYDLNDDRVQYTQVDGTGEVVPFTTVDGILEIGNLPIRTYYLTEVDSPEGYVLSKKEIEITVEPFGSNENYYELEFENVKEKINVTGTKVWVDGSEENRPTIWFKLFRQIEDGELEEVPEAEIKELANGTTEVEWTGLDKTDIDGNPYTFSVKEVDAEGNDFEPTNYSKTEDGRTVTNEYVIPTEGTAKATKEWIHGPSEHPATWFKLFRQVEGDEPEEVPEVEIKALTDGTTEVEWTGLEETDIDGNIYTFLVQEVDANGNDFEPTNYSKTEDGLTVTNEYVIPTEGSAKATKEWVGGPSEHPTTWFKLFRQVEGGESEEVPEVEIKALTDGTTEVEWTGLEETDIDGNPYTFSVQEVDANGIDFEPTNYAKAEEGLTVTNTYEIPTDGTAAATKVWEGGPENRSTVWFKLYRQIEDGPIEEVDVDILELTNGTTEVEWTGLEETDIDGNPYTFSVKEVDAEGNDFEPTNYSKTEDGLTVTNEYVIPTEGSAKATKEWVDGPSEHPTTWFKLFRQVEGGELKEVPEAEINELANGTTEVEWTGLEETDFDGNVYTFFVKEVNKDGDDSTPENYEKAENGLEVTNYYVSPTDASAKAIKTWENGPQERPTVWFKLFRQIEDGELEEVPEAEIKELSSGTTEVVWNNLTKTDENANEYIFSVKEVDAEGNDFTPESYSKSEEGLNVINTYVIPETEVTGNKIWIDGEEVKPTIDLQLYRDGKPFGEPVSLENGVTEYTWSGLDKTDINGNVYKYTIDEVKVPENYEKAISEDGLTVTNTHIPEKPGKETPVDPKDSEESDDDSNLPKTGEVASYTLLALILVGLGFSLRYYSKRRTN